MSRFAANLAVAAPLFALVAIGYAMRRWLRWPKQTSDALTRFVFSVAVPALLFRSMTGIATQPSVGVGVLIAFFGGCAVVFVIGRLIGGRVFRMPGAEQSIFAMGGVFSNNLFLGLPLARAILGDGALPTVGFVLVFNSLFLWTLATVSVEWARTGSFSVGALARTLLSVLRNPVVAAILAGTAFGLAGLRIPHAVDQPLSMVAATATPLALIALGMALVDYGVRNGIRISMSIVGLKLVVQPLVVWGFALTLHLPALQVQVVTLLASIAVGTNVYLMSQRFRVLEGPVAASLVLSTALAALTTPAMLALVGA